MVRGSDVITRSLGHPCNVTRVSRWRWSFPKHRPVVVSAVVNLSPPGRFKHTERFERTRGTSGAELHRLSATEPSDPGGSGAGEKAKQNIGLLKPPPSLQSSICVQVPYKEEQWDWGLRKPLQRARRRRGVTADGPTKRHTNERAHRWPRARFKPR